MSELALTSNLDRSVPNSSITAFACTPSTPTTMMMKKSSSTSPSGYVHKMQPLVPLLTLLFQTMIPFAVVGSEQTVIVDGKSVRGRKNRWGVVNVENEQHCEFMHLRNFLTRSHLQDLIETTAQIHYEAFRSKQLLALKDAANPRPSVADR